MSDNFRFKRFADSLSRGLSWRPYGTISPINGSNWRDLSTIVGDLHRTGAKLLFWCKGAHDFLDISKTTWNPFKRILTARLSRWLAQTPKYTLALWARLWFVENCQQSNRRRWEVLKVKNQNLIERIRMRIRIKVFPIRKRRKRQLGVVISTAAVYD